MTSYNHILKTNNPDKEIEYFWLTFKNSVMEFLTEDQKIEINNLSDELNSLQIQCQYNKIEIYIKTHIEKIGWLIIKQDNFYRAEHLKTNMIRWKKLTGTDIYNYNNDFYCLFKIYLSIKNNQKRKDWYETIIKLIIDYDKLSNRDFIIKEIVIIAIHNNAAGILDKLSGIYKFNNILPNNMKVQHNCSGKSLLKLIKKEKLII
jgi:hypothetical protein